MSDLLARWEYMFERYSEYMVLYVRQFIQQQCHQTVDYPYIPTQEQLELFYPNLQGDLQDRFGRDMRILARYLLINYGRCEVIGNDLDHIHDYIRDHLYFERMNKDLTRGRSIEGSNGGGKYKYKGRSYVIRKGERSGSYILVKGKKVYLSQI